MKDALEHFFLFLKKFFIFLRKLISFLDTGNEALYNEWSMDAERGAFFELPE